MTMKIEIRHEIPNDFDAVYRVNELAFETSAEARLVERLRALPGTISLVALVDERIVGHIMFSRVSIEPESVGINCLGLAPMSVLPEYQCKGIGSALVERGIAECRQRDVDAVFVLGHTEYYPRFGFEIAAKSGFRSEYDSPEESFMINKLNVGVLAGVGALVKYDKAFAAL